MKTTRNKKWQRISMVVPALALALSVGFGSQAVFPSSTTPTPTAAPSAAKWKSPGAHATDGYTVARFEDDREFGVKPVVASVKEVERFIQDVY